MLELGLEVRLGLVLRVNVIKFYILDIQQAIHFAAQGI
jgi:hypothetical protein